MKRCFIIFSVLLSVLVGCSTPKLSIDEITKDSPYVKRIQVNSLDNNRVLLYMGDEFFAKPLDIQFDIVNKMRESYNGNQDFAILRGENEPPIYKFSQDTFQVFSTGDRFKISQAKQKLATYDPKTVFDFKGKPTTSIPISLSDNDKRDAWSYAQVHAKEKLKSPSSAKFPVFDNSFVSVSGDIITVNAYVDADNGFGANIRKKFTVTMDNKYRKQSIYIEE